MMTMMMTIITTRNKKKCIQAVRLCCLCLLVVVTFRWIARANIRLDEVSTYISKSNKVDDKSNNDNDTANTSMRGDSDETTNESDRRTAHLLKKDSPTTVDVQMMMKFEKSAPTRKFQNANAEIRFMRAFRDDLISGEIDRSKQQQQENENRPRIVHVWPPYAVTNKGKDENPFYPLDQAQNVTWQSLYEAQQDYNRYNSDVPLHIYCAVLWMDVQVIQNHHPPLCKPGKYNHIVVLDRSTHTEYPSLTPPIHYPFIQDIFTAALNDLQTVDDNDDGKTDWDFDYFIYTNSDIAVIKYFYTLIAKAITTFQYDAFVVNRRTIPKIMNNRSLTSNDLPYIEGEVLGKKGKNHPGTDCFVMDKSIITNINLGDLFLGNPPWARVLEKVVKNHLAYHFHAFLSLRQYSWTYHLGDDQSWRDKPKQNVVPRTKANNITRQCCYAALLHPPLYPQHWFQNILNCAVMSKNFTEAKNHLTQLLSNVTIAQEPATMMVDISSKVNSDSVVPAFIANGNDLEMKRRFYQVTTKTKMTSYFSDTNVTKNSE